MATPTAPVTLDTLIVVKIQFRQSNKKFKLPLKDLGPQVLPYKLRALLQLQPDDKVVFERYSDSQSDYVTLDPDHPQVYKTLFRAAKAKLKLRLRATLVEEPEAASKQETSSKQPAISPFASTLPNLPIRSSTSPAIARTPAPFSPTPQPESKPETNAISPIPAPPTEPKAHKPHCTLPFKMEDGLKHMHVSPPVQTDLAFRQQKTVDSNWLVFCNSCEEAMPNEHFHCNICENGDYDLCLPCVNRGIHCPGEGHWMVKRFVKNGSVERSTTERITNMAKPKPTSTDGMPGAFMEEKQPVASAPPPQQEPDRTCNCCVKVLPEREFVTCTTCEDYDLCIECHKFNKHGHHPGHAFKAATGETTLCGVAQALCNAGRNIRHSAVCDGCDKFIYGVRHKCLVCPDWDYCADCMKDSKKTHPRHRFVPIYEPLTEPYGSGARHYGVYCDGPLCKAKEDISYIEGVRYKCAVCHDTDFCANCEALPTHKHNHTHPLIKFKTPVRNVSVTTVNEPKDGRPINRLGDLPKTIAPVAQASKQAPPPPPPANTATQVQTIHAVKPTEETQVKKTNGKIDIRTLLAEPIQPRPLVRPSVSPPPVKELIPSPPQTPINHIQSLDAQFVHDTIRDGTTIPAGEAFVQVWTLRNPGPVPWPAGCSVRHVGGDNMLNVDNNRVLSTSELTEASETNVVGRAVEVGEEIAFGVIMKAPERVGTAISYWRLKTATGLPFGHRLWCHIEVTNPIPPPVSPVASFAAVPGPLHVDASAHEMPVPVLQRTSRAIHQSEGVTAEAISFGGDTTSEPKSELDKSPRRVGKRASVKHHCIKHHFEQKRKAHDAHLQAMREQAAPEAAPIQKQETAELPVDKAVEALTKSSDMIFPQLEKESPASSTHEAVSKKPEVDETQPESATEVASTEHSDEEFFEDAESVEIRSLCSDGDEGFMTDEEYDILNASDEEAA